MWQPMMAVSVCMHLFVSEHEIGNTFCENLILNLCFTSVSMLHSFVLSPVLCSLVNQCQCLVIQSLSLSHGSPVRRAGAQPLFDLAMAKDEVKARLSPVPVYTVANPKNEFVLVAGEVSETCLLRGDSRQGSLTM